MRRFDYVVASRLIRQEKVSQDAILDFINSAQQYFDLARFYQNKTEDLSRELRKRDAEIELLKKELLKYEQ